MISRRPWSSAIVALSLALTLAASTPAPGAPKPSKRSPPPTREIAIVVNGQELPAEPAPRIVAGRVLVPIVRIFSALAITVSREGDELIAQAPNKTIRLRRRSTRAFVDNTPIALETPPIEIGGTTYVPLRLVGDALGATVSYDPVAERIEIASALVRREVFAQSIGEGKTKITGSLTALDALSQPPSMTVTYRGSVRTIAINSTAKVVLQDVVARSEQKGQLSDLHVGDAVAVMLNKDGSVERIDDIFGSRTGTIAAVSSSAIVLENGRVIGPDKTTNISLNGQAAQLSDLHVGDTITQRMNPETGETRELIAARSAVAAAAPSPGASTAAATVTIASLAIEPARPLKLGDEFAISLRGTPGGKASFDVGTFLVGVPMREEAPGVYKGTLKVVPGMNFTQVPVFGHLSVGGVDAPRDQAATLISAATIAPQITDVAPANGQIVNNSRPSIYATFAAPTDLGINASSVSVKVNGQDVTPSATRTGSFVTYTSSVALADGTVNVQVFVSDYAGNTTSRSWSFTIRTR